MRHALAIAVLVLSGVLLLLGLGQRTFLAGPAEISFPVDTQSEAAFAVIDGTEFAKLPGQANVVVRGADAFVATAMTRDADAWLAPYPHAELTVDQRQQRLLTALIPGAIAESPAAGSEAPVDEAEGAGLDPRGSDLWLDSRFIDGVGSSNETETLRVPVAIAVDQSVLIATNGTDPIPSELSLVWVQDRSTPWAGPLLAVGGLLALVGAVLYLLAIDHDRRGLGPRRGRRGPLQGVRNAFARPGARSRSATPSTGTGGTAEPRGEQMSTTGSKRQDLASTTTPRRVRALRHVRRAVPVLGIAVALGLTGCSAEYWPQVGPQPTEETPTAQPSSIAPVPVTEAQLHRIVEQISAAANQGDDDLDAAALDERFVEDALAQRTANYTIRSSVPEYAVVPPRITDDELDYALVQSTESWPRTAFITVASTSGETDADAAADGTADGSADAAPAEADGEAAEEGSGTEEQTSPSLALTLTQQSPHENFEVSRVIALRGGISMPQAAPAKDGTALLSNDIETLVLPPAQVGEAYAALLQNGADAPEADLFDLESDALLENYGMARAEAAQQQSDDKGQTMQYSATARQGDAPVVALSTGAGGALVATTVIDEQIVDAAGGRFKPQAQGAITALSGLEGEQERLVQQVAHQMLFFVPSKSEDAKIELLGVTSELVEVTN
ncbi:glycosyltransferase [Leucobacter sp. NPDC077196]|uniref:glycosyltransferase n=1 Tax=Leucobacter sp. NPDC077196 TaxID=3154959 RepID=UPI00343BFEE6